MNTDNATKEYDRLELLETKIYRRLTELAKDRKNKNATKKYKRIEELLTRVEIRLLELLKIIAYL